MDGSENSGEGGPFRRTMPLFLLFFLASGCAALIYEVVWFHLLRQVIGASAVSLAIVLTSYMGGMFLGSLGFPRWVSPDHPPLRVYAYLEAGIAASGAALLVLLPLVGKLYVAVVGYGQPGIALRALVSLFCLLPPTMLMGATLPAIARCLQTTRIGMSRLGLLYMANLAGGASGCLLAGFYLLRVHDIYVASFVAVSLNASVALAALAISSRTSFRASDASSLEFPSLFAHKVVYLVIALSGLTALGSQIVWTRLLSQVLGGTVFSFTIILAIFIAGLGVGSSVGAALARQARSPYVALGWCQFALVAAIPLAAHLISSELPYWQLNPAFASDLFQRYTHDLVRTAVAILPATCLWGASFPLALAAAAEGGQEPGRLAGGINAANTIGAVVGALLFGTLMIPTLGTSGAQKILAALSAFAVLLMLASRCAPQLADRKRVWRPLAAAASIVGIALLMIQIVPPVSKRLIAVGHRSAIDHRFDTFLYAGEGVSSSIAVTDTASHDMLSLHINGKSVASTGKVDMRIERMTGHLPALIHPSPRTALVVGFGAGVTAGSLVLYPEIERIVICEIEPLVVDVASEYFASANYRVLEDPRVEVIYDDARHYIATTREKFDIVTSDPIHPWMDGAAALFSVEYYELAKRRLNPGGVVAQWVPLYETDEASVKSEIASFMEAFPDGILWSSHIPRNDGNDLLMVGQVGPIKIDVGRLAARIDANPRVAQSLAEVDLGYLVTLLAAYIGRGPELGAWLEGAEINREHSLRLQYLAGMAVGGHVTQQIYGSIARYRRYPEEIFLAPREIRDRVLSRWSPAAQ